nr:GTP-binding protein OBGC, chloroplastic [Ipomoea trifida]
MVSELAGEGAVPPQLPTPARRLLEIAKLRDRLCRPIRRRFLLRRGVTTLKSASCVRFLASFDLRRSFNFAERFLQRRVGAAVGGGGGLAIVDASKPVSLRAIVSFILLFLQINKSLSTVLFKSNQPTSWSRSVRYSSKVLVNPLYAGVNRKFRSRSAKRTSAEFVNPSSVAIIVVPGADPWKARVQNSLVFNRWHVINSWSRFVKPLSAMLANPLFVGSRSRSAESTISAELIYIQQRRREWKVKRSKDVSELNDNDVVSFNSTLEYAAESKLAENIAFGEEVSKPESAINLSTKQTAKELGRDRIERSARSMMKRWSTWSSSMIDLRCYRFMMFIDFTEYWLRCQVRGHEDDVRGVCLCGSIDIAASGSKEFPVSVVKREDTHEVICVASKLVRRRRTAATEKEDAVCPESLNYVADTLQNAQISEFEISQDDASNTWHVVGSGLQRFIQKTN